MFENTMYDRIKSMSEYEMRNFIYWVYLCGNYDGKENLCDSIGGYFGKSFINRPIEDVMPNNTINDLWSKFEKTYHTDTYDEIE